MEGTLMIYLFYLIHHLKRFHSYFRSCHLNISLTIENEKDNKMSFLDVNIIREKDKFATSFYRKPTFSRIYTPFDSFLPSSKKLACYIYCYIDASGFAQIGQVNKCFSEQRLS